MSDVENKIRITPSKVDVDGKLLNIIESNMERFDISNIDFLNSGSWGYIKDAISMAIRDSAYYKTYLDRENNLSTAISPKSIYNHARKWNIDVLLASPAFVQVHFQIPVDALVEKISTIVSQNINTDLYTNYGITDNRCIVISKENPIIANDVYFTLEHSIAIVDNSSLASVTTTGTDSINTNDYGQTFIVKYCVDEADKTTEFGNYLNRIINSSIYTSNGVQYLIFTATAYQYKTIVTERSITSTNKVSSKVFTFDYSNQIAGMSIDYSKGNTKNNVDLYFSNIRTKINTPNMYAYYSLADEGVIEINFMNGEAGLPQNGGKITFRVFETLGAGGNIVYTNDVILNPVDNIISDLPITVSFVDGESIGGADAPTLDSIKELIINKVTTRDTIITESDLNKFLAEQIAIFSTINGTAIEFKKERDNIIKRSFVASIMSRINSSNDNGSNPLNNVVVPTNTIDLYIPYSYNNSDMVTNGIVNINPNSNIYYDSTNKRYCVDNGALSNAGITPMYNTPFNISVRLNKFKKCGYMYLATNDSCELTYSTINSLNNVLMPSTCRISKNISDNKYVLSFYVTSDIQFSNDSIRNKPDLLKLIVYLTESAYTTYSVPVSAITTSDVAVGDSNATLKQQRIDITLNIDESASNTNDLTGSSNITVKFEGDPSATSIRLNSSAKFALNINTYSNTNYTNVTLISRSFLNIYTELDDIMSSDIKLNMTNTDSNTPSVSGITVKDVPVVANYWYTDINNKQSFIEQLMVYINILKENTDKLELNTSFNLKFTNTYGTSYYYDSISTNIRLKLNIYLNQNTISSYSSDKLAQLCAEIRSAIRNIVDMSNQNKELSVSKIQASVFSMYYNQVSSVDFVSLNGTFNQQITRLSTTNNNYIPEYFNLDTTVIYDNGVKKSRLDNDIRFFNAVTGNIINDV